MAVTPNEKKIWDVLPADKTPIFCDEIALMTGLSISDTLCAMTLLELRGVVVQSSGKRFARAK